LGGMGLCRADCYDSGQQQRFPRAHFSTPVALDVEAARVFSRKCKERQISGALPKSRFPDG
jgi:hypothetical protein